MEFMASCFRNSGVEAGGSLQRGVALDPKHKLVIVSDKYVNAVLTYSFPEVF